MSLLDDLKCLVREGFRLVANLTVLVAEKGTVAAEKSQKVVVTYFRLVGKWSLRILIAALIPLVVIIPCLVFRAPLGWLYGGFVVYCIFLLCVELALLLPIAFAWRLVRKAGVLGSYPDEWWGSMKNVVFNGLSLAFFAALIPVWRSPGAYPLLLVIFGCWLALPLCSISSTIKRFYPAMRAFQFGLLAFLLVTHMVVPEYLAAIMGKAPAVPGLMDKQEITSQWRTIKWFDDLGHPKVWYSGSAGQGYRLWDGMGYDNDTREKLRPVEDVATKNEIVTLLNNNERINSERQALRQAEMGARLSDAERAERERQAAQQAEKTSQAEAVARQQEAMEKEAQERQKLLAVPQKEVTSQWKTIAWFNNAGMPNVWYSGSDSNSYRLWSGIGFDPDTAEALRPVSDESTKNKIVAALTAGERLENERLAIQQAEKADQAVEQTRQQDARDMAASRSIAQKRYFTGEAPPGVTEPLDGVIAIMCLDKETAHDAEISLRRLAETQGWRMREAVFSTVFVRDGLFDSAFEGHVDRLEQLDLQMASRTLLLGKLALKFERLPGNQGLTTCRGSLELRCIDSKTGAIRHSDIIEAFGTAFSDTTATGQFQKQLADKLGATLGEWKEKGM